MWFGFWTFAFVATLAIVVVCLGGRTATDRVVAVLFASYAAQRLPEANRVAAWVTASERPPNRYGSSFAPGASLRGRPAAVQRLLECDDEGRAWVTLNRGVDIGLGVSRRAPVCGVMGPVVGFWWATRDASAELSGDAAAELAAAIGVLHPTWSVTAGAAEVDALQRTLTEAVTSEPARPVLLTVIDRSPSGRADRGTESRDQVRAPRDVTEGTAIVA